MLMMHFCIAVLFKLLTAKRPHAEPTHNPALALDLASDRPWCTRLLQDIEMSYFCTSPASFSP